MATRRPGVEIPEFLGLPGQGFEPAFFTRGVTDVLPAHSVAAIAQARSPPACSRALRAQARSHIRQIQRSGVGAGAFPSAPIHSTMSPCHL